MGKHYTTEFKLQILQPILNGEMSIREAARFYNIPSNALVGTWLERFEKSGIKGLIPRKPSGRPPMSPKYAKMPSPPKIEEDRSRLSTNGKSQENPTFNAGTWTSSAVKKRQ